MTATTIIKDKIRKQGPVSFHEFMDTALYHNDCGYYTGSCNRIGTSGDYYTSPSFTPLFGEIIAKQIVEMWQILDKDEFTIIEYGGGKGRLCLDILEGLKRSPDLYDGLRYFIVERSIGADKGNVPFQHEKVCWLSNTLDLRPITGCILSNELIDNFPVHRVVMKDTLQEVFIDFKNNAFTEVLKKDEGKLQDYLSELNIRLPCGYRTEINLDALDWLQEISGILEKGFVVTIDYGYDGPEFFNARRDEGNLVCYFQHTRNFNPYINIGEQDITTHVNFSALYHWGLKNDLNYTGFTTQHYFLRSLGIANHVKEMETKGKLYSRNDREAFNMIYRFLVQMGDNIKVLVQQKGVGASYLEGLKFNFDLPRRTAGTAPAS